VQHSAYFGSPVEETVLPVQKPTELEKIAFRAGIGQPMRICNSTHGSGIGQTAGRTVILLAELPGEVTCEKQ